MWIVMEPTMKYIISLVAVILLLTPLSVLHAADATTMPASGVFHSYDEMVRSAEHSLPPVWAVTTGPKCHWFGYYDKYQLDPSGRYLLCMEVDFEHRLPRPEDAVKIGMVDLADVAEAAASVLTREGHAGATYELAGGEVLNQVEVAERLGVAVGRPVRAEAIDRDVWATQARQAGMEAYAVDTLLRMFTYYERNGFWGNSFVLSHLLGRQPATFADFLQRQVAGAEM